MKATYKKHNLIFKRPSGTSRGVLHSKETWFLILENETSKGIGECGLLRGLSMDDRPDYETMLDWVCQHIDKGERFLYEGLSEFPSIQMGLETAFRSFKAQHAFELFPSKFTAGQDHIPINGLIWMGDAAFMKSQIKKRLEQGFKCIKMKIGAIDFDTELELLKSIRAEFPVTEIELRVDANGAFQADEALEKLQRLSEFQLHSIEQPIKPRQWEAMARLCEQSPLPIALDEELIGVITSEEKQQLLDQIQPQFIILKPSFIGGFSGSDEWISLAAQREIGWWITSALESNVGLNAISQYTYTKNSKLPQGLGTGSLYTNNFPSPLTEQGGKLSLLKEKTWDLSEIQEHFG